MKLSGHSYNNEVFNSLLDGISKDIVLLKQAQTKQEPAIDLNFTTTAHKSSIAPDRSAESLQDIREDILNTIEAELNFASDRAKIALTQDDYVAFAKHAVSEKLRGKDLERAAQKFCNSIHREIAAPSGTSRLSEIEREASNIRSIVSASYSPDKIGNGKTGGYMGMSRNPNTIWNSNELAIKATQPTPDEIMKKTKQAEAEFRKTQTAERWDDLREQLKDVLGKGIRNMGTAPDIPVHQQKVASSHMSMWSDDHEFNNIPEKTEGERIAEMAQQRAEKAAAARQADREVQPARKVTSNLVDQLFDR